MFKIGIIDKNIRDGIHPIKITILNLISYYIITNIKINSITLINNYLSNLYPYCSKKEIITKLRSIRLPNKHLVYKIYYK